MRRLASLGPRSISSQISRTRFRGRATCAEPLPVQMLGLREIRALAWRLGTLYEDRSPRWLGRRTLVQMWEQVLTPLISQICDQLINASLLCQIVYQANGSIGVRRKTLHRVLLSSGAPHGRGIRLPADQETPVNTLRRLSTSRLILDRRVDQHRMPDGKGQIDHLQRPEVVAHPDFVRAHKSRGS